jgi:5-methyltetrahydrofolate--homocysteine methyltransferase
VLARDSGASIIGGCCGTMPEHLRAMREALDTRPRGERPTLEQITSALGPFSSASDGTEPAGCGDPTHNHGRERRGRRRS